MPVESCQTGGRPGYRWGPSGKCYGYTSGDDAGRREAKRKAIVQGIAAGERPSASLALNAELALAAGAAETHLPELVTAYESAIKQAGSSATETFALTAAAPDWQPPAEGAALTAAEIAALSARLNKQLRPIWAQILVDVGKVPLARIEIAWDVKHPLVQGMLDNAAKRTGARLGEAVQFTLREEIAKAYEQGLSVRDAAANIRAAINDAAPWQADMLARTDLNGLSNAASTAAARLTGMGYKTWEATLDAKTRPEHAEAHGQTVAIDGTFTVGGEDCDAPGDPVLSDAMAANCRCSVVFGETLEEAQGFVASALPTSEREGTLMSVATKEQRRRRYQRRAAHAQGRTVPVIEFGENGEDNLVGDAILAAAIPPKSTPVVDRPWDGPGNVAKIPNDAGASVLRAMYAFVIPGKDPNTKAAYHLPHHEVVNGRPGAANIPGVRNAMGRAAQIKPALSPQDMAGVRAHLQRHLDDFNKQNQNSAMTAAALPRNFDGTAAIEGKISDDNSIAPRVLLPDSLSWPEMPVSFMAQTVTAEGHDGAEVAGRVDEFARRRGTGKMRNIDFKGELTTPFGVNEIAPMLDDKTMRYVSADLGASEWALVNRQDLSVVPDAEFDLAQAQEGAYALGLVSGKIKAVTLVPTQAIEGAMVALTASADEVGIGVEKLTGEEERRIFALLASAGQLDDETREKGLWRVVVPLEAVSLRGAALTASAAPKRPPRAWFETPEPPGKMPLTVTKEGRVYGHLAPWDSCHVSFLPSCVPPPRSPSAYARFHTAPLEVDDGTDVWIGKLMFSPDGGHANRRLNAQEASRYYDRTGMAAAYLRAMDGEYGVWVCGSLNPDLSDAQREEMRRQLRLNPPSGDWRPFPEGHDLICGLAVAVPGFPVGETRVTVVASAEGVEIQEAIIANAGWFEADPAATAALEHMGLVDEDALAERRLRVLAARSEGMDALASLIEN